MAEPVRTSSDVPEFDTYPAPAVNERTLPPIGRATPSNAKLNAAAEKIGSNLGSAVAKTKRASWRTSSQVQFAQERGRGKLNDMRGRMEETKEQLKDRVEETTEQLKSRAQELTQDAREAAEEWKQHARERMREARRQARQFAQEKPLQVIAGVAVLGFAIGVGLRIWRWSVD